MYQKKESNHDADTLPRLISVVVPVYNVERTLEECVESIYASINQCTKDCLYEVLLVEDCSTDKSKSLAEKIAGSRPSCRLVSHSVNLGLAEARNTGLKEARGKYVAWVDSDDLVTVEWFSAIVSALGENPDLLAFDFSKKDQDGMVIPNEYGNKRYVLPKSGAFVNARHYIKDVLRSMDTFAFAWTKVIKRDLLVLCGYDAPRGALEDMGLMLSVAEKIQTVFYIPKQLYIYRISSESLVGTLNSERRMLHVKYAMEKSRKLSLALKIAAMVSIAQLLLEVRRGEIKKTNENKSHTLLECQHYMRIVLLFVLFDFRVPIKAKLMYVMCGYDLFTPFLCRIWN